MSRKDKILTARTRPARSYVATTTIPPELRSEVRWVCWRWHWNPDDKTKPDGSGRWTKVPINARTGSRAATDNKETWCDFETARSAFSAGRAGKTEVDGIGFVLGGGFFGVDVDECVEADEHGELTLSPLAKDLLARFATYAEFSPTGTGLKMIARGELSEAFAATKRETGGNRNDIGLECYTRGRFFTVTGDLVDDDHANIGNGQEAGEALVREFFPVASVADPERPKPQPLDLSDQAVLDRAFASKNGPKIKSLFGGDWSAYKSQSQGDLALTSYLAWWFRKDEAAIDRVFRSSGLFRAKWERKGYRDRTIIKAVAGVKGDGYEPPTLATIGSAYRKARLAASPADVRSEPAGPDVAGEQKSDGDTAPPEQTPEESKEPESQAEDADGEAEENEADEDDEDEPPPDDTPLDTGLPVWESVKDPHRLAAVFLRRYAHGDRCRLIYHADEMLEWRDGRFRKVDDSLITAGITAAIRAEFEAINRRQLAAWEKNGRKGKPPQVCPVTRQLVGNVANAVRSLVIVPADVRSPAWLANDPARCLPDELVPCLNGILVLPDLIANRPDAIINPTPNFFNRTAVQLRFDAAAPSPVEWLKFLAEVFEGDQESIDTLQEWFGYCIVSNTSLQKALMMIGPRRSGKGTICRTLKGVVGRGNYTSLNLIQLSEPFGLEPLVGKAVAIVEDCRVSDRHAADTKIVEQLLTIIGEGDIAANRKNRSILETQLSCRFTLCSNEMPRLNDPSCALPGRLIILRMTKSFYGRENPKLWQEKIAPELPSILLWAIAGWQRLTQRGHFVQPATGATLIRGIEALASPVKAFVEDRCELGEHRKVQKQSLYASFKNWCDDEGRKACCKETFGKELFAAFAAIKETRPRIEGEKKRTPYYVGIDLLTSEESDTEGGD